MALPFSCVVVTSSNAAQCELFKDELLLRRGTTFSPTCKVIALSDPLGTRVGSGGATFHAISEVYDGGSMLILHSGGDSRRNPLCTVGGKAFAALNFDPMLLEQLGKLPVSNGVLIAATDTLMTGLHTTDMDPQCFTPDAVTGVGIFAAWDFGTRHGIYFKHRQNDSTVSYGILQKASKEQMLAVEAIDEHETVILDSGIVHLGENVVRGIVELLKFPPFLGLTSRGMDSGVVKPIRFELYTDFLGALKEVGQREAFLNADCTKDEAEVRLLLCQAMDDFSLQVLELPRDCEFIHVGTTHEHHQLAVASSYSKQIGLVARRKSFENAGNICSSSCVLVNSHVTGVTGQSSVGDEALVEHCKLTGYFSIGKRAIVSQVEGGNIRVEDDMVLQQIPVDPVKLVARFSGDERAPLLSQFDEHSELCAFAIFGVSDGIKEIFPSGTFCNMPWRNMDRFTPALWNHGVKERTLWNAQLFPVLSREDKVEREIALWLMGKHGMVDELVINRWKSSLRVSLSDLVWIADTNYLFRWRHQTLPALVLCDRLLQAIANRTPYPSDCLPLALLPKTSRDDDSSLRNVLLRALDNACCTFSDESLCARTLSLVADLLAGDRQPRSGDSANPEFAPLLLNLARSKPVSAQRADAVKKLATLRESSYWSCSYQSMTRVARHYDSASQSLTGRCLLVEKPRYRMASSSVPDNIWIHSSSPARIDIAGGWTDTPPITNESGGAVCNAAVTLKAGQHCLGASARKFFRFDNRPSFVFRNGRYDSSSSEDVVTCLSEKDFDDYFNPRASAALGKCVCLALLPLKELFALPYSVELCLWSDLPAGSGLGGSSILAACCALSVSRVFGFAVDREDVVRTVLQVEQLLSTGGGWQDQIGAIYPQFKIGTSLPTLPIRVDVFPLPISDAFAKQVQARAVLVQTGPARLARDLLQNVVRRWHQREPEFTDAIHKLRENARRMSEVILQGNFDGFCTELNEYWQLKKLVAGIEQAEPDLIRRLFKSVQHLVSASSLCGAGGGGFALLILQGTAKFEDLKTLIHENYTEMLVHPVFIDPIGLRSWSEEDPASDFTF